MGAGLLFDHLLSAPDFLRRQLVAGIDCRRFFEQRQCFLQIALIAQLLRAMHLRGRSQKTRALKRNAILEFRWFLIEGLFVVFECSLVVLTRFRFDTFLVGMSGGLGSGEN